MRAASDSWVSLSVREALFELFSGLARGRTPRAPLLDELWSSALRGGALHRLAIRQGVIAIEPSEEIDLDLVTGAIALRAVRLSSDLSSRRLRICEGKNCGWLFLDTSKAGAAGGVTWRRAETWPRRVATRSARRPVWRPDARHR